MRPKSLGRAAAGRPRKKLRPARPTVPRLGAPGPQPQYRWSRRSLVLVLFRAVAGHGRGRLAGVLDGVQVVRIVNRRRKHVPTAGPLAQVDEPAALAAKGELRLIAQHQLAAG